MAHKKLAACAFLGGVGNDVFFTWLPLVDNFFHSQCVRACMRVRACTIALRGRLLHRASLTHTRTRNLESVPK
jgi:hypothetical protein